MEKSKSINAVVDYAYAHNNYIKAIQDPEYAKLKEKYDSELKRIRSGNTRQLPDGPV